MLIPSLPHSSPFLSLPRSSFACEGQIIGVSGCRCSSIPQLLFPTEFKLTIHTELQYVPLLTQHAWHKPAPRNVLLKQLQFWDHNGVSHNPNESLASVYIPYLEDIVSEICVSSYVARRNKMTKGIQE